MSTDTPEPADAPSAIDHITLRRSDDGEVWLIRDEDTGVATQGDTREEALEMLDEAVALHKGEIGESIDTWEEEKEALEEMGIDSAAVKEAREDDPELPEFMQ